MTLIWILGASILETIIALIGQLFVFLGGDKAKKHLHYFISFAVGTLLGVVFLEILPEGLKFMEAESLFAYVLGGFLFFFILSRFLFWYHCHNGECPVHKGGASLVLVSDTVHNFIDGVIIALAFLANVNLGIITTFAVLLHEMPQEMSDFFILLHKGYTKNKALFYNFLVATTTIVGAVLTYFFAQQAQGLIGPALGIVAGNFLYIAASDLLPELHAGHKRIKSTLIQLALILLGVCIIYLSGKML
jgi:zinc and cadmium transporter